MYNQNDGLNSEHILQNQFTAYLRNAVHNGRIDYLRKKTNTSYAVISMEDMDYFIEDEDDFIFHLVECENMQQALQQLKERERFVLLARIIEEKSFSQIAAELGMSYKCVTAIYYRTLEKLRKVLGRESE